MSYQLDLDSAYFLIKQAQDPTVLIVVDNKKKKVFWYPIQTSSEAREALENKIIQSRAKNSSITLHIDTKRNVLNKKTFEELYSYLKQAKIKLSKEAILRTKTDQTLRAGLEHINAIEKQMYELGGFDWVLRGGEVPTPGSIFSVGSHQGKNIDYLPNEKFNHNLLPKIKLRTKFSTKIKKDMKKFRDFRDAIENGKEIQLDSEYIDLLQVSVGSQMIDSNADKGKVKIIMTPQKNRQVIFLNNGTDELEHLADVWSEQNELIFASIPGQELQIRLVFRIKGRNGKFSISVDGNFIKNASHQLQILSFIRNIKELAVSFSDVNKFKHEIFRGKLDTSSLVSDKSYDFAKALAEIEQKSGVPIPFPLPNKIKQEDISNVFWVHRLLTQGKITQKISVEFKLSKKSPEKLNKGKYICLKNIPPEVYLFGKLYVMPGLEQVIVGKITNLKVGNSGTYKVEIKKAEISIQREKNSELKGGVINQN